MSAHETRRAIEAIVMVAEEPVPPQLLAQLVEVGVADVEAACRELAAAYEAEGRGFELVRVGGGYRYQSHPDASPYVERFVLEGQTARLSGAALETLAIVAYKQPISRAQVAAIRGVNVDAVVRTLQQRGYIDEIAKDTGPGNAVLFGTTRLFLEKLGLDKVQDLPPLGEFVPGADILEALEHGLRVNESDRRPSVEAALAASQGDEEAARSSVAHAESVGGAASQGDEEAEEPEPDGDVWDAAAEVDPSPVPEQPGA